MEASNSPRAISISTAWPPSIAILRTRLLPGRHSSILISSETRRSSSSVRAPIGICCPSARSNWARIMAPTFSSISLPPSSVRPVLAST